MPTPTSLSQAQQDLINVVKATHQTLAVARKTRSQELSRRLAAEKLRIRQEAEAALEAAEVTVKMQIDVEIANHASAQDEALIAAYNAGVSIRKIALDGFGNQYDGTVHQLLAKLRDDGRVGSREGYKAADNDEIMPAPIFPTPVDVEAVLTETTTVREPVFTRKPEPLVLVPAGRNGEAPVLYDDAVIITLDPRDPWYTQVAPKMRPGSSHGKATTATLYLRPFDGALAAHESAETSDQYIDHPVARWVKDHPEQALAGFNAALAS